jgi:hypothetical protein
LKWKGKRKDPNTVGLRHGFRSGLEAANAAHLKSYGIPVVFEEVKIKYPIPATVHSYTPDFELPNGIIVETKGRFMPVDRAKHLYVRLAHPGLDIRFVFSNPNAKLSPKSKTTYAMWAEGHGFKWAAKLIPIEWAKEPPSDVSRRTKLGPRTIAVPPEAPHHFANCARQPHAAGRQKAP